MAATDTHATGEELLAVVVSARSVPKLYNESHLALEETIETAVRRAGSWCEMAASLGPVSGVE
jgi:hypothetical protein